MVPSQRLSPGLGEHGLGTLGALDQHVRNLIALRQSGCDSPGGVERFWKLCVRKSVRDGGRKGGEREKRHTHRGTLRRHVGQEPPASLPHIVWVRETLPGFGVVCAQRRARSNILTQLKQFSHGLVFCLFTWLGWVFAAVLRLL